MFHVCLVLSCWLKVRLAIWRSGLLFISRDCGPACRPRPTGIGPASVSPGLPLGETVVVKVTHFIRRYPLPKWIRNFCMLEDLNEAGGKFLQKNFLGSADH